MTSSDKGLLRNSVIALILDTKSFKRREEILFQLHQKLNEKMKDANAAYWKMTWKNSGMERDSNPRPFALPAHSSINWATKATWESKDRGFESRSKPEYFQVIFPVVLWQNSHLSFFYYMLLLDFYYQQKLKGEQWQPKQLIVAFCRMKFSENCFRFSQ